VPVASAPGGWYHAGMDTLETSTIDAALTELEGWERDGDALRREYRLDGFRDAIDLIVRIADLADDANHHPELTNVYNRLTVVLTTHDAGGITQKDLDLAAAIEATAATGS
jgi:4a-hydroxytetrahydrobiopterin dehydratase